jgi:hypothetical protein
MRCCSQDTAKRYAIEMAALVTLLLLAAEQHVLVPMRTHCCSQVQQHYNIMRKQQRTSSIYTSNK